MYLHVTSSHPNSVKTAIPYGLGIRAKRICSEDEDYSVRRTEIKTQLRKRGYTNDMVEKQLKKVDNLDRKNLLQYNTKKQNNHVPLVITYSKALPNIHEILKKNMKILYNSEKMKRIFDEPPIVSYKRDKNIKDILVYCKHNLQFYGKENGCKACGKNCALCLHIIESTSFKDNEGNTYNIQGSINCKTVGVIYCILCTECEKNIYVGQTGDKFYQRMLLNFSKIRTQKVEDPVAKLFCQKNHCVKNFKVIGIEKTGSGDKIYRETKESLWIKKT